MEPATIKLFLVDGKPTGLRTAEISNWSGKAIAAPRSSLQDFLKREEVQNPGIYFLSGSDPDSGEDALYIGEAEVVAKRVPHHSSRDYWVSVVAFVSKDENLTKAHIKYLEGKLIERAVSMRLSLVNSSSSGSRLPESDAAEMDVFLSKILQLLPVLGIPHFNRRVRDSRESSGTLRCSIKGLQATENRTESGFLVYAGSQAVLNDRPSATAARERRKKLRDGGILKVQGDHLVFTEDFEFSSPSMAGAVIRGGSTNGLTAWKNARGIALKDIESSKGAG